MKTLKHLLITAAAMTLSLSASASQWIRINQLGYLPQATKVAVLMCNDRTDVTSFQVIDTFTGEVVLTSDKVTETEPLQYMKSTFRLNFSELTKEGTYHIKAGDAVSQDFPVNGTVYNGTSDFVLNYMRSQRCGWNPHLKDSCHTKDAYIRYHPTKEGQWIDVTGGWHDANDRLQYTTTSANAIYQMMFAFKQNPEAFGDEFLADGTPGRNGIPDIIDEIYWGLVWLDKMNPAPGEFYNQIADDRDHMGYGKPSQDNVDYGYGPGNGRVVYYVTGEPQQRKDRLNETTGAASIAGKFASDFALGAEILKPYYPEFAEKIGAKATDAYQLGIDKPGNCQTASVRSPYIYEETNWVDDMELGAIELYRRTGDGKYLEDAVQYGRREPVTPWMGADSARHYQWYPFMNMGHYLLAENLEGRGREEFVRNLRAGISRVYEKAQGSPFLYGIPPIWCSNNLTTAMLTQCILYRQLTGDRTYEEMEGSLRDWLFGCNPWGISMIKELPIGGLYPVKSDTGFERWGLRTQFAGLVDGPVYENIFNSLLGVHANGGNNFEEFQPGVMVYHDAGGDYSTNEPTMDGTASLTFPLSAYEKEGREQTGARVDRNVYTNGGINRFDPSSKKICLVFTAANMTDGADPIISTLRKYGVKGGFFFTGEFFEKYPEIVKQLIAEGHYVGSHSYGHLLTANWKDGSTRVTREQFTEDMLKSYALLREFGIEKQDAPYFIPAYENYNSTVASWADALGLQVINFTPGTWSNTDYTHPGMKNGYISTKQILDKIEKCEKEDPDGLGGHFILIHFGTVPQRTDKLYDKLGTIITKYRKKGYEFVGVEEALGLKLR